MSVRVEVAVDLASVHRLRGDDNSLRSRNRARAAVLSHAARGG